jgi:hypothetical protein
MRIMRLSRSTDLPVCVELGVKAIKRRHYALVENSVHHYPEHRREGWDARDQTELQVRHINNNNAVRFSLNCSL